MKHIIDEQYFSNEEELSKKVAEAIFNYLQRPDVVKCISIHVEPVHPVVGERYAFKSVVSIQFRVEGYEKFIRA